MMVKKNTFFYLVIFVLAVLLLWQWLSKGATLANLERESFVANAYKNQLERLSGIGALKSAHLHADVKVYINGQAIDFSQRKYQLASDYLHFEEGIGEVIHTHATGLTIGHLSSSLGMKLDQNCLIAEGQSYCNDNKNKLKFYVNGKPSNEFQNKVIQNLDKYLISYGNDDEPAIQKQLDSVTNLAPKYNKN